MAYVVRASGADLSQAQVIEYVARQVFKYLFFSLFFN